MKTPSLPPSSDILQQYALLLDVDGTLLDIAPTPESVVVPDGLPATLAALHRALHGALAIISGRPLAQIDALTANAFPAAAEHGAVLRIPPAPARRLALPTPPPRWREAARAIVARAPGARIEDKGGGFVLHYRAVPGAGPELGAALRMLLADEERFEIMRADMAWEVRPRGADKGTAAQAIMRGADFAGRVPLFVGDDTTDLDAIRAVRAMGGIGLLVADAFGSPAGVRAWLARVRSHIDTTTQGGA